jgi:hypothetical protein
VKAIAMNISNRWLPVVLPIVGLSLTAYLGFYVVGQGRFDEQDIAFVALGVVCGAGLLYVLTARNEKRFKQLLIVWPMTLGLGYRGAEIGANTIFLPQVIIFALTGAIMLRRVVHRQSFRLFHASAEPWLWLILLLGTVMAIANSFSFNRWFDYWLSFGMFGAVFFCVYELELHAADLIALLSVLIVVMAGVAVSGLVENYLGIGYGGAVVELVADARGEIIAEDTGLFFRVGYVTWGSFLASSIMVMCAGLAFFLVEAWRAQRQQLLMILAACLCVTGVIISGYRGLWLASGVIFLAALFFRQRQLQWGLAVLAGLILTSPDVYYGRVLTLLGPQNFDSSAIKRLERADVAWNLALKNPLVGLGWEGAGSVHNDWIELAANVGFPAAALFFGLVVWLIYRLFQAQRQVVPDVAYQFLARGLCVALVASLVAMASQTFFSRQLVMAPFWTIFVAAERLLAVWPPPRPR